MEMAKMKCIKVKCIKHLISTLCVAIILTGIAAAENGFTPREQWNKTFGGELDDSAISVLQTSEGGYIIAATADFDTIRVKGNAVLIRTDPEGNVLWEKTFSKRHEDKFSTIQETGDGGYILTGTTDSLTDDRYSAWLVKTDSEGNEEWNRTFSLNTATYGFFGQQTDDGGYIISGCTYNYIITSPNAFLLKTDPEGNEEWNRTFGNYIKYDSIDCVRQTEDGGYIAAGETTTYGMANKETRGSNFEDIWLIKIDGEGNEEWNRTFGGEGYDWENSVRQTADGGYIIGGQKKNLDGIVFNAWLIKTDPEGTKEWDRVFETESDDYVRSVQQTPDGGYIFAGYTGEIPEDSTIKASFAIDSYDGFLVRTDKDGNEIWKLTFGGEEDDRVNDLKLTSDGGYAVVGSTKSFGEKGKNVWLVKLEGNEVMDEVTNEANEDKYGNKGLIEGEKEKEDEEENPESEKSPLNISIPAISIFSALFLTARRTK